MVIYRDNPEGTHFINVDLDIFSRVSLQPLVSALGEKDCVVIVTDHSTYNYKTIVEESQLVIDTRNATKGLNSPKIVRC